MELDNTIATPLYKQLENMLLHEIQSGQRPAGSKIPTEKELSEQYNVSRVTIRKALAGLTDLGYLNRKSGKGTFVAEKKLQRGLSPVAIGFTEMCKMMGAVAGAKTIKIALEDPTPAEAESMDLKADEKILVVERIRYADQKPVMLETNKFPESFSFLFSENLNDTSLYEILQTKYNIVMDHSTKTIDLIFATAREANALGITKGYPILRIDSIIHDTTNSIKTLSQQLCVGDKFKLIV